MTSAAEKLPEDVFLSANIDSADKIEKSIFSKTHVT